jgi:5-methylcytosine-specific restriction protein A
VKDLDRAKAFIEDNIFKPAQDSSSLDPKIKSKVIYLRSWVNGFAKVGDIFSLLETVISKSGEKAVPQALNDDGLLSFEDILDEFDNQFGQFRNDVTSFDDFVEGVEYSAQRILTLPRIYDTRTGGIMPVGEGPKYDGIVIKATLTGGKYPNAWIEEGRFLKYYLKSIKDVAKVTYKENAAVINSTTANIYTFLRHTKSDNFAYVGKFSYRDLKEDEDGSKWFILEKDGKTAYDEQKLKADFDAAISTAKKSTGKELAKRLKQAPKKPKKVTTTGSAYIRNPDVVAAVLIRADGICELCKKPAPFKKKSGEWYLEVHHIIQLAHGGDDTVDNAVGTCPNCHREQHFG